MAFQDDELLQDFLVEAGEIQEKLGEQLVELENRPDDKELLNAVFRGFHTIKGGASFLTLTPLVEVCHAAEDVFNLLRNGQAQVDAYLMDVILRATDAVTAMFAALREGRELEPVDRDIINKLHALASGEAAPPPPTATPEPQATTAPAPELPTGDITDTEFEQLLQNVDEPQSVPADASTSTPSTKAESEDISEEEFDHLLDELHGKGKPIGVAKPAPTAAASDEITETEFDQLLDELHGKGKVIGGATADVKAVAPDEISENEFDQLLDELHGKGKPIGGPKEAKANTTSDEINDAEFEKVLDDLHGKGKFSTVKNAAPTAAPKKPPQTANESSTSKPATPASPAATQPATPAAKPAAAPAASAPAAAKAGQATGAATGGGANEAETTVRVDTKRLDDIMNMVGELVLARNRLVTLQGTLAIGNEEFAHAISNLDLVTGDLQTAVMKTRMQPIKKVFGRFPRVVRDLARSLNKEVNLTLQGEDTDLDKNLVEALADPLVHLVRNAVDHGIETPQIRESTGKSKAGTVILAAEQEGDHILLTISDDGAGIDPDKLKKKAVEKGVIDAESAARMDSREAFNLIFLPGFSTKEQISDVSGRGVGMDVVKTRITQLNGTVEIDSKLGHGTRFSIKVPLTLAIMPTLMVMLGKQIFALPLVNVSEIFNLDLTNTNRIDGQEVILLRDHTLPIFYLSDWLEVAGLSKEHPKKGHVVVVSVGDQRAGFVVETLIGQEEVVIKPLGAMLHGTKGFAGATITGDGRIALILDVPSLLKAYARRRAAA